MPLKDTGTEQLIKETTKRLLFAEGKLYATTQAIADAAGINRTAVHYYYRTRDQLIGQVFNESMLALSERLDKVITSEKAFRPKVEELIDVFLTEMMAYPYEETFLVTEINNAGHKLIQNINEAPIAAFLADAQTEMEAGTIEKMNPIHFLMNLFSLLSYPIIMAPLYQQFFQSSKEDFDKLIGERKEIICRMLFK